MSRPRPGCNGGQSVASQTSQSGHRSAARHNAADSPTHGAWLAASFTLFSICLTVGFFAPPPLASCESAAVLRPLGTAHVPLGTVDVAAALPILPLIGTRILEADAALGTLPSGVPPVGARLVALHRARSALETASPFDVLMFATAESWGVGDLYTAPGLGRFVAEGGRP